MQRVLMTKSKEQPGARRFFPRRGVCKELFRTRSSTEEKGGESSREGMKEI